MIKALIKYSDYLMKTRGKIEPKVGDNVYLEHLEHNNLVYSKKTYEVASIENLSNFATDEFEPHLEILKYCYKPISHFYVEIDLPEIKWVRDECYISEYNYEDAWIGYLGSKTIEVFWIGKELNSKLYYMLIGRGSSEWKWEGTLEECKQQANELLFKI